MSMLEAPQMTSDSPIRVVSWTATEGRTITAVHAPDSQHPDEPWMVYVGSALVRRVSDRHIPASAVTLFGTESSTTTVIDGLHYEIVVDQQRGTGVRNGPLTAVTPDRPWAVSLYVEARDRLTLDALPDSAVTVVRPLPDSAK